MYMPEKKYCQMEHNLASRIDLLLEILIHFTSGWTVKAAVVF